MFIAEKIGNKIAFYNPKMPLFGRLGKEEVAEREQNHVIIPVDLQTAVV